MAKQSGTRSPRTRKKTTVEKPEKVKEETIVGAVNEPGSGRHETPPVHGGEGTAEWPR